MLIHKLLIISILSICPLHKLLIISILSICPLLLKKSLSVDLLKKNFTFL
jgi:hypothetical protein